MAGIVRKSLGLILIGGVGVGGVAGWATGLYGRIAAAVRQLWAGIQDWLSQPLTLDRALVGLGGLAAPVILLVVLMALADS